MLVRAALPGSLLPSSTELPLIITPIHPRTPIYSHYQCQLCPKIIYRRILYSAYTHQPFHFTDSDITCTHSNVVYCLICIKCNKMYIGQTSLNLRLRFRKQSLRRMRRCGPSIVTSGRVTTPLRMTTVLFHWSPVGRNYF